MATAIRPRSIAVTAKAGDRAWRGRALLACAVLGLGVLGVGALSLDWSGGPAMAVGQLAGLVSPLAGIGLLVWAGAAFAGRRR
jgi:hypothetical protein